MDYGVDSTRVDPKYLLQNGIVATFKLKEKGKRLYQTSQLLERARTNPNTSLGSKEMDWVLGFSNCASRFANFCI